MMRTDLTPCLIPFSRKPGSRRVSMKTMEPGEMAKRVGAGLLSFPVTHFGENFEFQPKPYQEHIAWLLSHKPAGLFAAGGTGEVFSLTLYAFSRVGGDAGGQTAAA